MPSLRNATDGTDITPEVPNERGHRAIKWVGATKPGTLHLSTNVRYGSVDGHDLAIGKTDIDIRGSAPTYLYRVELLLPKAGDRGLLIAEDIDRSCPGPAVAQWIGKQSKTNNAPDGVWWRLKTDALSDDQRLSDLIKHSKKAEIRLKRKGKTTSGNHYQNPLTIVAELDRSDERTRLAEEAKKWIGGDKKAKSESVGILSEIAGVADLDPDEADVYLTDATTGHRIKPWQIDDVFIYPTGDSRPNDQQWKSEIMARLSVLSGSLGFDVEW